MESLRLKNIKAFSDTKEITLAPLTIFVGQNSAGKSSFLRFPAVLSQTLKCAPRTELCLHKHNSELVDYGNFYDVLHNHSGKTISCSFMYLIKHHEMFPFYDVEYGSQVNYQSGNYDLDVRVEIEFEKGYEGQVVVGDLSLFTNGKLFCKIRKKGKGVYSITQKLGFMYDYFVSVNSTFEIKGGCDFNHFMPDWKDDTHIFLSVDSGACPDDSQITKPLGEIWKHFSRSVDFPGKGDTNSGKMAAYVSFKETLNILRSISAHMERDIRNLYYIGPLRDKPQRIYRIDNISDEESRSEADSIVASLYNQLRINDAAQEEVDKWLEQILNCSIEIEDVDEDYFKVCLLNKKSSEAINICDVGYGISQLLPIIITCSLAKVYNQTTADDLDDGKIRDFEFYENPPLMENPMIVIEQPELHLHPAAQSKLAELFEGAIYGCSEFVKRKILVETHSEHFIRALQVLVADPSHPLTKDMIKIYYAESDDQQTVFTEMKIAENGQFETPWPTGFFDKSYILTKELLQAVAQRNNAREGETKG